MFKATSRHVVEYKPRFPLWRVNRHYEALDRFCALGRLFESKNFLHVAHFLALTEQLNQPIVFVGLPQDGWSFGQIYSGSLQSVLSCDAFLICPQ